MTIQELEKRVIDLENKFSELESQSTSSSKEKSWENLIGRHANDPVFEEIVRLGQEYRKSLHPDYKKSKTRKSEPKGKK